jgi:hypothetical protein
MTRFGKANAWAWLPRDLLASEAWRSMSIHCRRFIDFLMIDHCAHAGRENGRLQATYNQLVRFGISRRHIARAIRETTDRGLVRVTRAGGLFGVESRRTPSLYRLTWIGTAYPAAQPTNEWRRYQREKISRHPHGGTAAEAIKCRKVA